MSSGNLLRSQTSKFFHALAAVADAFSGTVYGKAFKMNLFQRARILIHKGVGTTGTSTVTVQACSDGSHTGATPIPFKYSANLDTAASDAMGTLTDATTAGFTTTAGSAQLYSIEVDAKDLPAGLNYVEVKCVEVVDSPVLGGIVVDVYDPRFMQATLPAIS